VLRTYDVAIGYQDEGRPLFHVPDLVLKRGECAALIGPNGAGKTTYLKTLLGALPPLEGEVLLGASLDIGYFAQAHEDLDPRRTLVEEIEAISSAISSAIASSVAPGMLLAEARDYLARFLFTGEDVFRTVSTLSGGERGRLALAKLSLTNANLLLLDEPTNHLDIPSQEILQEVLQNYQGTILLVSHDRYLIDALGTQIWEIEPDEAAMRIFAGTYTQYRAQREVDKASQAEARQQETSTNDKERSGRSSADERKRKRQLKEVEEQIAALEERLESLANQLESPPPDPELVQRLGTEYVDVQNKMEGLMGEWEGLLQKDMLF